jgi:MATE family multidrug resistance protein
VPGRADPDIPSRRRILALAWPIVLANCATPLLGLTDTAVIGHVGAAHELGAIALGALVFSFVFWAFGFLRMGTTGFTARAAGAGDTAEERAVAARGLLLALAIGCALLALQWPLATLAMRLFEGSDAVEEVARRYVLIRIWSAPATLAGYVVTGWLIGLGRTRDVLGIQLLLNVLNAVLDVLFAAALGWGVAGIAFGTVLAEWLALGYALRVLWRAVRARHEDTEPLLPRARLTDRHALLATLSANRDLMIRTVVMLAAFAWFTNAGARFGDTVLAANHVLLQVISFSAFFLDGFAFAAEGLVGRAAGAGRRDVFAAAVRHSTELAAATAGLMALALLVAGEAVVALLTSLPEVRAQAAAVLPWVAAYVALSFAAFQLDGIFIGTGRAAAMRNASLASAAGFAACYLLFGADRSVEALWAAFVAYVVLRALALLAAWPRLSREAFGRT